LKRNEEGVIKDVLPVSELEVNSLNFCPSAVVQVSRENVNDKELVMEFVIAHPASREDSSKIDITLIRLTSSQFLFHDIVLANVAPHTHEKTGYVMRLQWQQKNKWRTFTGGRL